MSGPTSAAQYTKSSPPVIVPTSSCEKLTSVLKMIGPSNGMIQSGIVEKNVVIASSWNASLKSRAEHFLNSRENGTTYVAKFRTHQSACSIFCTINNLSNL